MILRKPYAFLIKNFRLIHLILFVLLCFIIYYTSNTFTFFVEAIKSTDVLVGKDLVNTYATYGLKVFPIIVLALLLIILWIFIVKRKSFNDYIAAIVIIIVVFVISKITESMLLQMEISVIDSKSLRLVRDLLAISILLQIYPLILTFIRCTGFDIKKFDFGKDLDQLKISEVDREEFEVDLNIDTNLMRRKNNYRIRHLKYFYKENKFVLSISFVFLILIGAVMISIFSRDNHYEVTKSREFNINGINVKFGNNYVTSKDYEGDTISTYDSLLMIETYLKSSSMTNELNTSKFELLINNHIFTPISKYKTSIMDVGEEYITNKLTKDYQRYLLVYEIPTTYVRKSKMMHIIYSIDDSKGGKVDYYKYGVNNVIDLDKIVAPKTITEGKDVNLSKTLYGNTILRIDNSSIADKFIIKYKFCPPLNSCYESKEYVQATFSGTDSKTLIKMKYNLNYDVSSVMTDFNTFKLMLEYFGKIVYTKDEKIYTYKGISSVNPTKVKNTDYIYIEIPKKIADADEINLSINIRSYSFVYKIK